MEDDFLCNYQGKGGSRILKWGGGGGVNFCNNVREIKYYFISIITQVIIEILAPLLVENGVIFRYNHLRRGGIIAGRTNFQNSPPRALPLDLKRKLI